MYWNFKHHAYVFLGLIAKRKPMISADAVSYCISAMGSTDIIIPDSAEANRDVQKYMKELYLKTAWIGIFAISHDPKWIIANES